MSDNIDRLDMTEDSWVNMVSSWGATKPEKRSMRYTAWVRGTRGGFEMYDTENSERYYAEGGLWFTDPSTRTDEEHYLCDYDGIYALPIQIVLWLDTLGRIDPSENDFHRKAIIEELGVDA